MPRTAHLGKFHDSVPSSPPKVEEAHCLDDHDTSSPDSLVIGSASHSPISESPLFKKSQGRNCDSRNSLGDIRAAGTLKYKGRLLDGSHLRYS
jgi:hypothetical protein